MDTALTSLQEGQDKNVTLKLFNNIYILPLNLLSRQLRKEFENFMPLLKKIKKKVAANVELKITCELLSLN